VTPTQKVAAAMVPNPEPAVSNPLADAIAERKKQSDAAFQRFLLSVLWPVPLK
jgi:hypothetical protein